MHRRARVPVLSDIRLMTDSKERKYFITLSYTIKCRFQEMKNTIVTISDVAKAAGVTNGTVDRVLHERGEVSQKTREKVLKVIEELGYRPNVYASMLARNKSHRIAVIVPNYKKGEFWELSHSGVEKAREYSGRFSVNVEECHYDEYDVDSFISLCHKVIEVGYSGAIIAPMFLDATRTVAVEMEKADIPFVILNTSVSGVYGHLAYFGQPIYDSGAFCADILMSGSSQESRDTVYLVRIERDVKGLSDPSKERRRGFTDYLTAHFPKTQIRNVVINPNSPDEAWEAMDREFSSIEGCPNVVTLNSRIYLVSDYLREGGVKGWNVIGYDTLERNIAALKDGYVKYLIAQHADRDALDAVTALTDFLVLGKRPEVQDNFSSIDLLSRYNCRFY